jgi:hypothetical protein
MKKFVFFSFLFLNIHFGYSQCIMNCHQLLKQVIDIIEQTYPGYQTLYEKIELYKLHKNNLLEQSKLYPLDSAIVLAERYVSFFDDYFLEIVPLYDQLPPSKPVKDKKYTSFEKLDDETALLEVVDFYTYSLRSSYDIILSVPYLEDTLKYFKNLIIDLREAQYSPAFYTYYELLQFLYSQPFQNQQYDWYFSKPLIEKYSDSKGFIFSEPLISENSETFQYMKKHIGEYGNIENYTDTQITYNQIFPAPRKVVILINEQCKYDWEHFIYLAKQSKKVTLMGQPTYGAFDYIEPLEFMLSSGKFYIKIPVARSSRVPQYKLNGIGIQPDIFIKDSTSDWVQIAVQYLEKNY